MNEQEQAVSNLSESDVLQTAPSRPLNRPTLRGARRFAVTALASIYSVVGGYGLADAQTPTPGASDRSSQEPIPSLIYEEPTLGQTIEDIFLVDLVDGGEYIWDNSEQLSNLRTTLASLPSQFFLPKDNPEDFNGASLKISLGDSTELSAFDQLTVDKTLIEQDEMIVKIGGALWTRSDKAQLVREQIANAYGLDIADQNFESIASQLVRGYILSGNEISWFQFQASYFQDFFNREGLKFDEALELRAGIKDTLFDGREYAYRDGTIRVREWNYPEQ